MLTAAENFIPRVRAEEGEEEEDPVSLIFIYQALPDHLSIPT